MQQWLSDWKANKLPARWDACYCITCGDPVCVYDSSIGDEPRLLCPECTEQLAQRRTCSCKGCWEKVDENDPEAELCEGCRNNSYVQQCAMCDKWTHVPHLYGADRICEDCWDERLRASE